MSDKKARVEPEEEFPGQDGPSGDGAGQAGAAGAKIGPVPDDEAGAPEAAESDAERIARLEGELAELRDKWVRALAEAENIRRRAERDRRDAEAYGGTRLARDMLLVWDNLERAMKAADEELRRQHGPFLEGVELTQRELLNTFTKHRIQKVTPARGDRFDPNLHQAMFEAPVPGAAAGTVIEVLQDGFTIGERLLRPAMVGVARAMPDQEPETEPAAAAGDDEESGAA